MNRLIINNLMFVTGGIEDGVIIHVPYYTFANILIMHSRDYQTVDIPSYNRLGL